ncbi:MULTISPECIES: insecticidal delta-endotoxin Cry8Ea1 family protein [Xenorhabdus]|uniref:insecticidal delta-endotoxin Cry8Ea1 family protein n=1 Tax=Xenorhabdus TaxID=626 RepID=UPI000647A6C2|nr:MULTISPECIES: insecticidal delta-endotoxin Cry8Ea1 family protein [Xenorhabdus]MBC8943676.1 pesticidal crystal protein [Xenorhabdus indica]
MELENIIDTQDSNVKLHILTLEALNMIKTKDFNQSTSSSPLGVVSTVLSILLKLTYKKLTEPKEVDVIGIIQDTLIKYTSEWLESEYQAVRKDAESLQDAISAYQKNPTDEARQLIVVRNEIAISNMRRLCILSINTAKSQSIPQLSSICALSCLLYFFTLRDTIVNGVEWGYSPDNLEKYSKSLAEQADIMFNDILIAAINNYNGDDLYEPQTQAKRSMIYWTSDYTNIQSHLTFGAQRKPSRVCLDPNDTDNLFIDHNYNNIFLGDVFLNGGRSSDNGGYNYLSATEPRSYDHGPTTITLQVKSAGRYRLRMYYAYMTDSLSFNYEVKMKLQQSRLIFDQNIKFFEERVLTPYKAGSNYGPVIYRTTEVDLEAGTLELTLHEDNYISGNGFIQHIEFLGL